MDDVLGNPSDVVQWWVTSLFCEKQKNSFEELVSYYGSYG